MTKLEEIVTRGWLKENEEIYLPWRGDQFIGIIRESGKFIETKLGKFASPSAAAGKLLAVIDTEGVLRRHEKTPDEVVTNGWLRWKRWDGKYLIEIRKRLND